MDFSAPLYHLSQSHLKVLSQCPRKFQHIYVDHLTLPPVAEAQTEQQRLGTQFHHLMQQQALDLDVAHLLESNGALRRWTETFHQFPPELIGGEPQTEHWRSQVLGAYALIAVYDLLIQGSEQAQIVDWKTYARPKRADVLQQDWQTRLYLYLLAETSAYAPEDITMTYWFAEAEAASPTERHTLTFAYDQHQHQATADALNQVLEQLTAWRAAYAQGVAFPQVPLEAGMCFRRGQPCRFVERCDRQWVIGPADSLDLDALTHLDQMAEIPFESGMMPA